MAGRGIVEAMGTLHASREREKRVRLAVRVRIYTGLAVMVMHEAIRNVFCIT